MNWYRACIGLGVTVMLHSIGREMGVSLLAGYPYLTLGFRTDIVHSNMKYI